MKTLFALLIAGIFSLLFAKSGAELAKELGVNASSKAIKQWERMFESADKLVKIGADKLNDADKATLKEYLIKHAADSDQPAAAGI